MEIAEDVPSVQTQLFEEPPDETHNELPTPSADQGNILPAIQCNFCKKPVDPKDESTYAEVRTWVHGRKKDSAILREYTGEYACSQCIQLLRAGHHPLQKTLEETASEEAASDTLTTALETDNRACDPEAENRVADYLWSRPGPGQASIDEICLKSPDGTHCQHWWDHPEPCCFCGDNTISPEDNFEGNQ